MRYFVFDLDGTILDSDDRFRAGLADGLARLRDRGIRPLVITGRPMVSFGCLDQADPALAAFDDPILLSHGNVLLQRASGTVKIERALPEGIVGLLAGCAMDIVIETAETLVAQTRRAAAAFALAYSVPRQAVVVDPDRVQATGEAVLAVTVFGTGSGELTKCLTGLAYDLDTISAYNGQVIRPAGTCKAAALHDYLIRTDADGQGLSGVVAFGDARNDACLLGSAAFGVAVSNADEVAVRHSDRHLSEPLADFLATLEPELMLGSSQGSSACFGAHLERPSVRPEPAPKVKQELIVDLLEAAATNHGTRQAVRDGEGVWSYAELERRSHLVAYRLGLRGIGHGARVLCLLPGGRPFAALMFGALRQGAVLIPAVEDNSDYQLQWLLSDADPALVVTTEERRASIRAQTNVPVITASELVEGNAITENKTVTVATPSSPALMIYTSGSTARPKGIVCQHATVAWTVRAIGTALGYRETDVVYVRLPISFDYGLYQILLCTIAGAEIVFPGTPLSAGELLAIRDCGATIVPLVPTLATLLGRLAARDKRPTAVRLLTNTGSALVGPDAERVRESFPGASLICMYGMSECKRITIARPDEDVAYPGTVGRALPGTQVFILDDDGQVVPSGEIGQIVSAGPHVMSGYWKGEDAQRFVTAPGGGGRALRTGDYGYLDEEGRLYFAGRRDDIFKRRGWRTSSQEIESAMLDVPGVDQAACVPPGSDGVLTVWAVTRLEPSYVLKEIGERLGYAKVPDRCVVVEELPLTPHGKIDKAALRTFTA